MARVLITGGSGFIGSHLCLQMLTVGHSVVVLDDLTNSTSEALRRVASLAHVEGWGAKSPGRWQDPSPSRLVLLQGDILCREDLMHACTGVDAVIHLAGLKSVGESVKDPLRYWDINVRGTLLLLQVMEQLGCRTIVFSSSASIYGLQERVQIGRAHV